MQNHEFELLLDTLRSMDEKMEGLVTQVAAHDKDIHLAKMILKGLGYLISLSVAMWGMTVSVFKH